MVLFRKGWVFFVVVFFGRCWGFFFGNKGKTQKTQRIAFQLFSFRSLIAYLWLGLEGSGCSNN